MADNAVQNAVAQAKEPILTMVIQYKPSTGQIAVQLPQVDAVGVYGLLKMAEKAFDEVRAKAAASPIIPAARIPRG